MPLEPSDPRSMRVSHDDRDQVAEALRVAAGDGRLTMEELEERLESALAARTYGDLVPLLVDLPGFGSGTLAALNQAVAAEPVQAKELIQVRRSGGSLKYLGPWLVPKTLDLDVHGGSAILDFTQATVSGPTTQIIAKVRGGSLKITVPPGFAVDANEVNMRGGSIKDRSGQATTPGTPVLHRITVTGMVSGGSVVINPPREPRPPRAPGRLRLLRRRRARRMLGE
jgi:Domain of unknown function (DUF1707)